MSAEFYYIMHASLIFKTVFPNNNNMTFHRYLHGHVRPVRRARSRENQMLILVKIMTSSRARRVAADRFAVPTVQGRAALILSYKVTVCCGNVSSFETTGG